MRQYFDGLPRDFNLISTKGTIYPYSEKHPGIDHMISKGCAIVWDRRMKTMWWENTLITG